MKNVEVITCRHIKIPENPDFTVTKVIEYCPCVQNLKKGGTQKSHRKLNLRYVESRVLSV